MTEAESIIAKVFPEYDPALDWVGTDGGRGFLVHALSGAIRAGDVLATRDGYKSVVRYVDDNTLVTRQL